MFRTYALNGSKRVFRLRTETTIISVTDPAIRSIVELINAEKSHDSNPLSIFRDRFALDGLGWETGHEERTYES